MKMIKFKMKMVLAGLILAVNSSGQAFAQLEDISYHNYKLKTDSKIKQVAEIRVGQNLGKLKWAYKGSVGAYLTIPFTNIYYRPTVTNSFCIPEYRENLPYQLTVVGFSTDKKYVVLDYYAEESKRYWWSEPPLLNPCHNEFYLIVTLDSVRKTLKDRIKKDHQRMEDQDCRDNSR